MVARRPLVLVDGNLSELPDGDALTTPDSVTVAGHFIGRSPGGTTLDIKHSGNTNSLPNIRMSSGGGVIFYAPSAAANGLQVFSTGATAFPTIAVVGGAGQAGPLLNFYTSSLSSVAYVTTSGQFISQTGSFQSIRTPSTGTSFVASVTGDTAPRLLITAAGKISLSSGSAAADVTLERTSAGLLTLTGGLSATASISSGSSIKPGSFTAGTAPSASAAGAGAMTYIDGGPAWSDGTNWKRVDGTTVV